MKASNTAFTRPSQTALGTNSPTYNFNTGRTADQTRENFIYILFTSSCIYEVWGLCELGINIEWEGNHLLNSKFIIGDCWTDETCFENYNDCLNL